MLAKMMVAHVDVLSARAKLWKSCKFKNTLVVFKDFAVDIGFGADDRNVVFLHFLD